MLFETLPILESPLKKPKLDEEETSRNSPQNGNWSDDDDGLEHIKDPVLIDEYLQYEREFIQSDGFDIVTVPREFRHIFGSHALPCDLSKPEEWDLIRGCTNFAIFEYNRFMKTKSLQLESIEKANKSHSHDYVCYITFKAKDPESERSDTYQTQIFCTRDKEYKEMFFIRRKGQKKGILFPVDLDDKEDYGRIRKCADFGLSQYNEMQRESNSHLKLVRIVKAVQDTMECRFYCITLEAMDTILGRTNTYCAVAHYSLREGYESVLHLWPKGEKNHEFAKYEEEDDE